MPPFYIQRKPGHVSIEKNPGSGSTQIPQESYRNLPMPFREPRQTHQNFRPQKLRKMDSSEFSLSDKTVSHCLLFKSLLSESPFSKASPRVPEQPKIEHSMEKSKNQVIMISRYNHYAIDKLLTWFANNHAFISNGGIVTFTPLALRSNPLRAFQLIRQIDKHPLWASYIVPSALGLLASLECGESMDPMSVIGKKTLILDILLREIETGHLSLLEAPPDTYAETTIATKNPNTGTEEISYRNYAVEWTKKYFLLSPPSQKDALQAGVTAFMNEAKLSSKLDPNSVMMAMDDIIIRDIHGMQRCSAFMSRYRRFVVIDIDNRSVPKNPYVQGLEWTPLSKFSLNDNFF
ncbi:hypothetical protein JR316_0000846 [Psilocybe cubensis]|uniref:Uncharacterized protein n=1 Tax=Psilocybe cubensis TaxID=181762 RepID=A0ACB8HG13_PSICU|nr:hypothetical protein JR316_0000846 [Psilocybe cubensis]KAH9486781.1 hypothetical protein JR316_0000846 [Psilocybe cubensis]